MRKTLLGLIALGLVLGGLFWARGWVGPSRSPWGAPESDLPDVTLADAAIDMGDVRVTLSVSPRPPVAFERMHVRVRVEREGSSRADVEREGFSRAAILEGGRISFEMKMPMGDHRYTLVAGADGWHEAEVVLPFCPSGNPRWYATVEGSVDGRAITARFQLDLTRPASAPGP